MMKNKDFAVYILTYQRANKVITYKTLRDSGYTGKIYLVCSTDDNSLEEYRKRYGEDVLIFNKEDYKGTFDIGDNFNKDNVVVFARNAIFDIAEQQKTKYFLVLDDDYTDFEYRFDNNLWYNGKKIKNLDKIFDLVLDYYKTIPALSIAFAQGGDFIGGKKGSLANAVKIKRKIMNTFFCSTERRFKFIGRINEDVNTYVYLNTIGKLVFQTNQIGINQLTTQKNTGGLTEFYLDSGTYVKSFYTIIFAPSCSTIKLMGNKYKRLHHMISWNNTAVKILREEIKKK